MVLDAVRLALALAFAIAAVGKLVDLSSFREAATKLGVPHWFSSVATGLVPTLELSVALGLLFPTTLELSATVGVLLTTAFTGLLAVNLVNSNRPTCNCFGTRSTKPIGWHSIARNLLLILGLLCAGAAGGEEALASYAGFALDRTSSTTMFTGLLALVVVEAIAIVLLAVRATVPESAAQTVGLPPGTLAPSFVVPSIDGVDVELGDLIIEGRQTLLVFMDPGCGPCQALLPELAAWRADYANTLTIAVVTRGSVAENRSKLDLLEDTPVLLQENDEVATAYGVEATPSAVWVSPSRRIIASAAGAPNIRRLVEDRASTSSAAVPVASPSIGTVAPAFDLPAVGGTSRLSLATCAGTLTILVFWDPRCSYCAQLSPELQAFERRLDAATGPRMLVISRGATTKADTPFDMVALDDGALLRRAYGVAGTPSAVLLDAQGRIASAVAAGATSVMELARRAEVLTATASRLATSGRADHR